jgi:Lon protease-like protein
LFLLPGERTQLHIFEERYKALMDHCFDNVNVFGLACNAHENLQNMGSLVKVSRVLKRYSNGEMDIEILCLGLFRLKKFYYKMENAPWPGGYVEPLENLLIESSEERIEENGNDPKQRSLLSKALDLKMSLTDKLTFAKLSTPESQERFLDSREKLMNLLETQEDARFENTIYLN